MTSEITLDTVFIDEGLIAFANIYAQVHKISLEQALYIGLHILEFIKNNVTLTIDGHEDNPLNWDFNKYKTMSGISLKLTNHNEIDAKAMAIRLTRTIFCNIAFELFIYWYEKRLKINGQHPDIVVNQIS